MRRNACQPGRREGGRVRRTILPAIVVLAGAVLLGCLLLARLYSDEVASLVLALVAALQDRQAGGWLLFAAVQTMVATVGFLPASLLGIAAGSLYGIGAGFALSGVSTMLGAVAAFQISRSVARPLIQRMLAGRPRLQNLDAMVRRDGWRLVCLLRMSPVMPFAATSYLLGLSPVGWPPYLAGTMAALPALLGFVCVGHFAGAGVTAWQDGAGPWRWVFLGLGAAATVALTLRIGWLVRRAGLLRAPPGEHLK